MAPHSASEAVSEMAVVDGIKIGTRHDSREMSLMNRIQQFSREFGTFALTLFGLVTNSSWPYSLFNMGLSLSNGGPAGMLWMTIVAAVGIFLCDLSLAEMASISPSSAGPFQWTAELAPDRCQKALSFVVGYFDVLGWQAALAFSALLIGQNVQGLLSLFDADYVSRNGHLTAFMIASAIFTSLINLRPTNVLRNFSWAMGVVFLCGFLFIGITLAITAPHPQDAALRQAVTLDFQDPSSWGSNVAALVGILGPISTFVGGDVTCHMSEETRDASLSVPRAMYRAAIFGYTLTILMTVLVVFSVGQDGGASLLTSSSGQPYQQMFLNATRDETRTVVMVTFMLILLLFSQITTMTAASRQLFTFARDNGLPLSGVFAKVSRSTHIPWNSVILSLVITCLLALIPLGSVVAFNIITSLSSIAIFASYWISITCRLTSRFSARPIQSPRWNLGIAGYFVNVLALLFLTLGIVMTCFPPAPGPNAASFNWTVVIFSGVTILSLVYYFAYGRQVYRSPRSGITHHSSEDITEPSGYKRTMTDIKGLEA